MLATTVTPLLRYAAVSSPKVIVLQIRCRGTAPGATEGPLDTATASTSGRSPAGLGQQCERFGLRQPGLAGGPKPSPGGVGPTGSARGSRRDRLGVSERNQVGSWRRSSSGEVWLGQAELLALVEVRRAGQRRASAASRRGRGAGRGRRRAAGRRRRCRSAAGSPVGRPSREACRTTSWLDSTQVVGAPTASVAASEASMTARSAAASQSVVQVVEVERLVHLVGADVAGQPGSGCTQASATRMRSAGVLGEDRAPVAVDLVHAVLVPHRGRLHDRPSASASRPSSTRTS